MSQAPTTGAYTSTPPGSPDGQPDTPPDVPIAGGTRRLSPMHLAAIGASVALAAIGAVAWVLLGSDDAVTVPVPAASARPAASAAPSPVQSPPAAAVLATRNPFGAAAGVGTGVPDTNPTAQPAAGQPAAGAGVTATVTEQVSVPVVSTVTATTTATVTANPVYVFYSGLAAAKATLVVNAAAPMAVAVGGTTSGVTYVGPATGPLVDCAKVKRAGTADSTAVSVCSGEAVKLS